LYQTLKSSKIVLLKNGPLIDKLNKFFNDFVDENQKLLIIVDFDKNVGFSKVLEIS